MRRYDISENVCNLKLLRGFYTYIKHAFSNMSRQLEFFFSAAAASFSFWLLWKLDVSASIRICVKSVRGHWIWTLVVFIFRSLIRSFVFLHDIICCAVPRRRRRRCCLVCIVYFRLYFFFFCSFSYISLNVAKFISMNVFSFFVFLLFSYYFHSHLALHMTAPTDPSAHVSLFSCSSWQHTRTQNTYKIGRRRGRKWGSEGVNERESEGEWELKYDSLWNLLTQSAHR